MSKAQVIDRMFYYFVFAASRSDIRPEFQQRRYQASLTKMMEDCITISHKVMGRPRAKR
jgi:hypothetical protein